MSSFPSQDGSYRQPRFRIPIRVVIALIFAAFAVISYYARMQPNPVTNKSQSIPWTVDQEIALGMQSAPGMAQEFGGESTDSKDRLLVETVGGRIVGSLPKEARNPDGTQRYPFKYHVLTDPQTVNAFALPGGQIFITEALLKRLETEGQLAGVLGHETGHVLARHSAAQASKSDLLSGLVDAAGVAGSNSYNSAQMTQAAASMVANMLTLKYSRNDELDADKLGLRFMSEAGYDPRSMIRVMEILEQASGGSGGQKPEYASTHPNPDHRIDHINDELKVLFPSGVPDGLKK